MLTPHVEYEVHVSCVSDDEKWTEMLVERLRRKTIPTRLNDRKEPIAQQLRNWIREARNDSLPKGRKLIAVCSPRYLADSQSCQLIAEFRREQASRLVGERLLIPVLLDGCSPPAEWAGLPALDFSHEREFELRFHQLTEALDWRAGKQNGYHSLPAALIASILGSKAAPEKSDFADGVAEIYRALDWQVGPTMSFDSHSGEFLIMKKDAGFINKAFVECHERARQKNGAPRIVIASHPIPSDLETSLNEPNISRLPYTELLDELAPLKEYAAVLIRDFEDWRAGEWRSQDWFIRPDVTLTDEEGAARESAIGQIAGWLGDPQSRHLAILGNLGTGKTTLMRFLSYELAKAFLDDPLRHPAPVFIELLKVRKAIALKSVLLEHFAVKKVELKNAKRFEQLIKSGRIILLLDAFDEMADRLHDEQQKTDNLKELLKPATEGARIVITSRTHYFKSHEQQIRLLGQDAKYLYLAEFTEAQVDEYLGKARPGTTASDWNLIRGIYDLIELVRLPLFMSMVVKHLPQPGEPDDPRSSRLYTEYVNLWLEREHAKERRLPKEARTGLMEELAWLMWRQGEQLLNHDQVAQFTEAIMGAGLFHFSGLKSEEVLGEICTASFLKRDRDGMFFFGNHSFQEYFVASRLKKCFLDDRREQALQEMLAAGPLDRRVIYFLSQLNDDHSAAPNTP
jgi:NACHT domain/TIR domain